MKQIKFSAYDVVEIVAYADKMNFFLLKEAAIDFIVAHVDEVRSSGTLEDIPESKNIMHEILYSVATMNNKGRKRKHYDEDDLDILSMSDLRAELVWKDKDIDGSRAFLIARLRNVKKKTTG